VIDVWSVGCILAELIRRKPIFAAHNEADLIKMITNLIGNPDNDMINKIDVEDY